MQTSANATGKAIVYWCNRRGSVRRCPTPRISLAWLVIETPKAQNYDTDCELIFLQTNLFSLKGGLTSAYFIDCFGRLS